ncbi:MAG: hypothetical protein ACREFH_14340 [Stellaceae bacterium]
MARAALVDVRRHPAGCLEACPRAGSGRRGEALAGFLQSDVQGDADTARALLAEIAAAERGGPPQPGGAGNAFAIAIAKDGAVIRNAVLENSPPQHFSLAELRRALEAWLAAIEEARA